jgi:thiamine kinase-like enzyme
LLSPEHQLTLRDALEILPTHLNRLYKELPVTLTHNDYNPKNLMVVDGTIRPIDWSNAYLSPHMGDLYCLLREGEQAGVESAPIIEAYQSVARDRDLEWQISLGGLCWLIHGLRWVTEEGIHTVPGTASWVAPMMVEIQTCLGEIEGGR